MRARVLLAALALVGVLPLHASADPSQEPVPRGPAGCAVPDDRPVPGSGKVRRVGTDSYPTIAAAVQAAGAGDTVLIPPGVYHESVVVADDVDEAGRVTHRRDGLRIRGTDRGRVILDGTPGPHERHRESAFQIRTDRVVLENMTVRHYSRDPVMWVGVEGFWARYLTIFGGGEVNGASSSRCGQIDHVVAAGIGTAALAIAACAPCDTTIVDSLFLDSWTGIAALNSRGALHIGRPGTGAAGAHANEARDNHMGILLVNEDPAGPAPGAANSEMLDAARHASDAGPRVINNLVHGNSNPRAVYQCSLGACAGPYNPLFATYGIGIYVLGARAAHIEGNTVTDHDQYGIGVFGFPYGSPAIGNVVTGNRVSGTRSGLDLVQDRSSGPGNCWSGNAGAQAPAVLQTVWGCGSNAPTPPGGHPAGEYCTAASTCQQSSRGTGDRAWQRGSWSEYEILESEHPEWFVDQPAEGRDRTYVNDRGVEDWLPEVVPYCAPGRVSPLCDGPS